MSKEPKEDFLREVFDPQPGMGALVFVVVVLLLCVFVLVASG